MSTRKCVVIVTLTIDTEDRKYAKAIAENELQALIDSTGNDLLKSFSVQSIYTKECEGE